VERIDVYLRGKRKQVSFATGYAEEIREQKAADAAAANFVHSVDAAHLQLVALAAANEGIDLVTVHDCFGCIAPRAARLNEIIREQFIRLHGEDNNLLDGVLATTRKNLPPATKLPPVPDIGDLDIGQVAASFHAWK
jgi:Autographiviridae RNA polymerase